MTEGSNSKELTRLLAIYEDLLEQHMSQGKPWSVYENRPGNRNPNYSKCLQILQEEFNINFNTLFTQSNGGNGIDPDVAVLLCKLVKNTMIKRVMEIGVGLSTFLLSTICEQENKYLISLEDTLQWSQHYNRGLENAGISHRIVASDNDPANIPDFISPQDDFQLAWVDGGIFCKGEKFPPRCQDRHGSVFYYKEVLKNAVIMFDDGEDLNFRRSADPLLKEMGRDPNDPAQTFFFNPTERWNRWQYVILPEANHPIREVFTEVENIIKEG